MCDGLARPIHYDYGLYNKKQNKNRSIHRDIKITNFRNIVLLKMPYKTVERNSQLRVCSALSTDGAVLYPATRTAEQIYIYVDDWDCTCYRYLWPIQVYLVPIFVAHTSVHCTLV